MWCPRTSAECAQHPLGCQLWTSWKVFPNRFVVQRVNEKRRSNLPRLPAEVNSKLHLASPTLASYSCYHRLFHSPDFGRCITSHERSDFVCSVDLHFVSMYRHLHCNLRSPLYFSTSSVLHLYFNIHLCSFVLLFDFLFSPFLSLLTSVFFTRFPFFPPFLSLSLSLFSLSLSLSLISLSLSNPRACPCCVLHARARALGVTACAHACAHLFSAGD